jgi:hypothetical protein
VSRLRGLAARLVGRRDVVDVVGEGLGRIVELEATVPPVERPDLVDASGPVRAARRDWDAPRAAEGVLVVRGARLEARRALDAPAGVRVGRLVAAADGRPLAGATTLLDVASAPLDGGGDDGGDGDVVRVDGTLALLDLHGRSAVNYFHWHVDALASRWLVDRVGPGGDGHDGHVVPWGGSDWQRASLAVAGMDGPRTRTLEHVRAIEAERFLVPLRSFGSRRVPWWTVEALRTIAPLTADALAGVAGPRLLYVSRADATRRRIVGEEPLVAALGALGFVVVTLEGRDYDAQRRLFHEADVIVAPHGAALTNLVWARAGTSVVELVPARRPNFAFHRIAVEAGCTWRGVLCPPSPDGTGDEHDDLVVDPAVVLPVVERALAGLG